MPHLAQALKNKLIPWAADLSVKRFIVARPEMNMADMPSGVQLIPHKLQGKRVVVKDRRHYDNTRGVAAFWPGEGLNEVHKFKLACVLSGYVDYQLGDQKVQCGPGHFIVIPPGLPHPDGSRPYVDSEKSVSCELLFFLLHPNALQCWISRSQGDREREQEANYLILHERTTLLFRALMEEIIEGEEHSFSIGRNLLPTFLVLLQREAQANRLQLIRGNPPSSLQGQSSELLHNDFSTKLENYLQANLHKQLTIESVSREMFLSRAQFTRTVRRETGKSFHELLTAHRLRKAKSLLRNSNWTIAVISIFTGFKSPSYFRTFFRERTGKTPSEFRSTHG